MLQLAVPKKLQKSWECFNFFGRASRCADRISSRSYNNELNERDDRHPGHWDLGVYLTGIDLYEDYGYKDYGTLGLAYTNGMCHEKFSCVISEFGVAKREAAVDGDETGNLSS